jgi:carboxypeptidase Taq
VDYLAISQEVKDWKTQVSNGEFGNVKQWLIRNVHSYGNLYSPPDLIKLIAGKELSVSPYINYLQKKYSMIYGF